MPTKQPAYNDNSLAIAYYRYSSHSQNEASIEQQREAARAFADAHGLTIIREYDDPAISGTTADRPGYQTMLAEVSTLRPAALILWKADRLGRDRYEIAFARKTLKNAGCRVLYVAESIPDDDSPEADLMEAIVDGMADYHSKQHALNVRRGVRHNAERGLFNGHAVFGYAVDGTKHYIPDPDTAPVVKRIFHDYADGKAMADIARELNAQGLRTTKGKEFNSNGLRSILHNRRYIGEYKEGEFVIPDGMPRLVDDDTFERVQAKFAMNKRLGSRRANHCEDAPEFWLTGKLYCGHCEKPMHGTSGTSKTGKRRHYYYECCGKRGKRKNGCKKKNVRKEVIEELVTELLRAFLNDTELLMNFAHDAAEYYEKSKKNPAYIKSLEKEQREVEKSLNNIIHAIEQGAYSETLQKRLTELETRKRGLADAIVAERALQEVMEDEHSIKTYFYKYANANLDDPEVRSQILEYFVDKIYLFDDKLLVTGWFVEYSGSGRYEQEWQLGDYDVGFERFAHGSTIVWPGQPLVGWPFCWSDQHRDLHFTNPNFSIVPNKKLLTNQERINHVHYRRSPANRFHARRNTFQVRPQKPNPVP